MPTSTPGQLHHIELYVSCLASSKRFWSGFLSRLGYEVFQSWDEGISYRLGETYLVLVQAREPHLAAGFHRKRIGLNHLAFHAASRTQVDSMTQWVREEGYQVLYPERHPFAGGDGVYALYCEDPDRIKVELVAPRDETDSKPDAPV